MAGGKPTQQPKSRHNRTPTPKLACAQPAAFAPPVIRRLVLFVLLALAAPLSRAQDRPLILDSDFGDIDGKTNERVLRGHARATDGTTLITADEIRYNQDTETITATGHAVFTRKDLRLLADKLVLLRKDQTFRAERVRFGVHPYYAEGESATGSLEEITLNRAVVTYGEPGPWQPTFRADKIIYAPGQRLRADNAQAGIGHAQPLPFPRFQQGLKDSFITSFATFNGGYRSSLGAFGEAGVQLPVAAGVRLGGDLGVYSARGVMFGPSARYGRDAGAGAAANLRGYFRSGYINDHGDKETDLLGRPVPENRGYVEWQHEQKLSENLSLTAQLNWWKDSEILRDFRPRAFFPVQAPDTFAEATYTGQNFFLSLFARFQPNSFQRVQERLPELRFDLLPLAVGNGFYQRFQASAAVLRESQVADGLDPALKATLPALPLSATISASAGTFLRDGPQRRTNRLDAYYAIERPFAYRDWLAFTPVAGARVTSYSQIRESTLSVLSLSSRPLTVVDAPLVAKPSYTRTLGEIGFDAALRSSATFNYKNPLWKIDGLRHLLTPRVSYRYIPDAHKGADRIPAIDRRTFATYLPPLGLGDQRNLDDLSATNTLRVGFDNTLQTRDPVYGSRDLLTFNVANDFRFKRNTTASGLERRVSETHAELAFAPANWVSVDVYQSFAPQSFTLREFNSGVTLRDGEVWSVRFSNNFLRHQIQDYQLDARLRLNETYEALSRLHYDARKRRFNEQAYGLAQNLGNTWLVSYVVSLYSGPRRESNFGLNVQIEARGF